MNVVMTGEDRQARLGFQAKCRALSLYAAVALAFSIPISTLLTNMFLFSFVLCWFLGGQLWEKVAFIKANPVTRPFVLLFLVFCVGSFYSTASSQPEIVAMLNKMGKLLYLPFLISVMQNKQWRQYAMVAFLSAMVLTLVLGLLKVYGGLPIRFGATLVTPAAVFRDHIFTNLMMAFASFMVGHYLFQTSHPWMRVGLFSLLFAFVYYIFWMSHGRSGQAIFLGLWMLFFIQRGYIKPLVYGSLVLGFLLLIALDYSTVFHERILTVFTDYFRYQAGDANTSLGSRLEYMGQTWELCRQRLLFGFGTGSYSSVYGAHATVNQLLETKNPHNEYLNVLFQVGLIGLMVFLSLFWTIIRKSRLLLEPERFFAAGIGVTMLIGCIANSWLMDFTSGYFFVILTAVFFGSFKTREGLSHG